MPVSRLWGVLAVVLNDGVPSKTMTRSAKYVAMMKSCSTTKAVFFEFLIKLKKISKIKNYIKICFFLEIIN